MSEALLEAVMKKFSSKDEELREEVWELLNEIKDDILEVTRQKSEFEEETSLTVAYKYPYEIERYHDSVPVCVIKDLITVLEKFQRFGAAQVSVEFVKYNDKKIVFHFDTDVKKAFTKVVAKND